MSAKNLNLNANKISDIEEHIRDCNERKRKLIEQNKMTVYDMISEIYKLENQALVDAVTTEHQLIEKLRQHRIYLIFRQVDKKNPSARSKGMEQCLIISRKAH